MRKDTDHQNTHLLDTDEANIIEAYVKYEKYTGLLSGNAILTGSVAHRTSRPNR